jgi:CRISPR-associated protein Cas6
MPIIDVLFPVQGTTLPTDHLYALYGALSRVVPAFHNQEVPLRFASITGLKGGKGLIRMHERSRLRLRLPAENIATVLPLVGRTLSLGEHGIHLGVPQVVPLSPVPSLMARLVTIKKSSRQDPGKAKEYMKPDAFLEAIRQELKTKNIQGEPGIPLIRSGQRRGEPRRQVMRIKGRRVIGYALWVTGLTAEESLTLQEQGLGGRTRMGCGLFISLREKPE